MPTENTIRAKPPHTTATSNLHKLNDQDKIIMQSARVHHTGQYTVHVHVVGSGKGQNLICAVVHVHIGSHIRH